MDYTKRNKRCLPAWVLAAALAATGTAPAAPIPSRPPAPNSAYHPASRPTPQRHADEKQIPPFKLGRPHPGTAEWVDWPWTGDQRRYVNAEWSVRGLLKHDTPRRITAWFEEAAKSHPSDPLAQFLWAYSAQAEAAMVPNQAYHGRDALTALQGVDPGDVREYARIRYDMTLQLEPNNAHPDIERVGDRLLGTDPKDEYTRKMMIYDLCNGTNVHKAVRLASAWASSSPKDPKAHATLAYVYQNLWFRDHRAETKALAVGEYSRYIALASASDSFRARAAYLIGVLQKRKN